MKVLRRLTWGSAKFWIGAIAVVAVMLAVAQDRVPTNAGNTEILPSLSGTSPTYQSSVVLVKGGRLSVLNTPCVPGIADPTALCLRIWANGVSNATGASAFQVHYQYPTNLLQVSAYCPSANCPSPFPWLGSTGRSVACNSSFVPGDGTIYCNTLNAPPPFGATGSGILATIAIESQNQTGVATFTLASDTFLVDTPACAAAPCPDPAIIPGTVRSLNIVMAPCADMNGDGVVTAADIVYVVQKFGTSDPLANLTGSGLVTAADILIVVKEFGYACTR